MAAAPLEPTDAPTETRRFQTSELPLSATVKTSIDQLVLTFKKHGEFDKLRRGIWGDFEQSVS
jgi:hypothetical protein